MTVPDKPRISTAPKPRAALKYEQDRSSLESDDLAIIGPEARERSSSLNSTSGQPASVGVAWRRLLNGFLLGVHRALEVPRSAGGPRVSDVFGLRLFKSIPQSGFSIVTLGLLLLVFFFIAKVTKSIGFWVVIPIVWSGIGFVFYRLRHRIVWGRLNLLKPAKPVQPGEAVDPKISDIPESE